MDDPNDEREPSLTKDEMSAALGFDPFADPSVLGEGEPGDQKGQSAEDDSQKQAGEAEEAAAEPKKRDEKGRFKKATPEAEAAPESEPPVKTAPEETPEPEPEKKEESPELAAMRAQNELLQQSVKAMQTALEQTKAQTAQATTQETAPAIPVPDYSVNLPDDLMEGLASEDVGTRKANMNALIKGTAQVIHRTVMQHVAQYVEQRVPTMVTGTVQERNEQTRVHNDFYGKYPHLAGAQALVAQEALALAAETGANQWNDQFRDAVHARVMQVLQGTRPAAATPAATPAPGNGAKPPAARRAGNRPGSASGGANTEVDIVDTLFGA